TFTVSAADQDSNDTLTYSISDNKPAGADFNAATRTFSWTPDYTQAGGYSVTFSVNDGKNPAVSETITITINNVNRAPIALAEADPISGDAPLTVRFIGSKSSDPDNDTLSYRWTFGDGSSSTQQNPAHIYESPATYTATVIVTDTYNAFAEKSIEILVNEAALLTVDIEANPDEGTSPLEVRFTSSVTNAQGSELSYEWDFGDGTPVSDAPDPIHVYEEIGKYDVQLKVASNDEREAVAAANVWTFLEPAAWLSGQMASNQNYVPFQGREGLLESYIVESPVSDFLHRSWTHDDAAGVIGLCLKKDFDTAKAILGALSGLIDIEGKIGFSYYAHNNGFEALYRTGAISWAGYSFVVYELLTKDIEFEAMIKKLADYILTLQDLNPASKSYGSVKGEPGVTWYSTLDNINAYFFLRESGYLLENSLYTEKANLIKDSLLKNHWNSQEDRFNQGIDDTAKALDSQVRGGIFLLSVDKKDMAVKLADFIEKEFKTTITIPETGKSVSGYAPDAGKGLISAEGTLSVARLYGMLEKKSEAENIISEVIDNMRGQKGGIIYALSTAPDSDPFYKWESVSGTAWLIIAQSENDILWGKVFLPAAPTALTASAISQTQINLDWTDNSYNETGFKVERKKEGDAEFTEISGNVPADSVSYVDKDLNPATKYIYRVRAYNTAGYSGYSNTADATTPSDKIKVKLRSLNPEEGPVGTRVTLTGENLNYITEVDLGETNSCKIIEPINPDSLIFEVPDTLKPSAIPYVLSCKIKPEAEFEVTPGNMPRPLRFTVTDDTGKIEVSITSIAPDAGPAGTEVTIRGTNINYIDNVKLGGKQCVLIEKTMTDFKIKIPSNLAPSATPYSFSYDIAQNAVQPVDPKSFTVTPAEVKIKVIDPDNGPVGTKVKLSGDNINYIRNIKLGDKQCGLVKKTNTEFDIVIPSTLAPSETPYTFSFEFEGNAKLSENSLRRFTVTRTKVKISEIDPDKGPPGTLVTITGENINYIKNVKLGGMQAEMISKTLTTLVFRAPDPASSFPFYKIRNLTQQQLLKLLMSLYTTYKLSYEFEHGAAELEGDPGSFTITFSAQNLYRLYH
ncbi:MAG: PKD domain-containing protein, partial [Candidatus Omnitrophota bacterium]|nr:PKD domain-containing protein [Candidatus Omnitrophota bacterium]